MATTLQTPGVPQGSTGGWDTPLKADLVAIRDVADSAQAAVSSPNLVAVGTTKTTAYTLVQGNTGELLPVNSAVSVAVTVPTLAVGTSVELLRQGGGEVTLTVSGTTLLVPTGSTATPRVQGSTISLLWLTTTLVLVGGDLT